MQRCRERRLNQSAEEDHVRSERNVEPVVTVDMDPLVNREIDRVRTATDSTTNIRLSQIDALIRRISQLHANRNVCCSTVARGVRA